MTKRSKQKFTSVMLRPTPEESKLIEQALKLTGEAAATKAVFRVLADFDRMQKEFTALATRLENTQHKLFEYQNNVQSFNRTMKFFTANKT